MQYIEVEYNRELRPLEAVLSRVKQPGDFFICGTVEMPMPRVDVEGAGTLSFPVPDAQTEAIMRAKRAPCGKGPETIVDTSVRKVWQVAPDKVKLGGKSWAANFETILSKVKAGLGCEDASVSAELYKLLVYDRGGFFLAHRDTEKADGMFGTLVVTLPSTYRGGALRIRHAGREVTVDTNTVDPSELSYVALLYSFYSVMPGHYPTRVCQHIHYLVTAPGHKPSITQLYFATDPVFEGDPTRNFSRDPLIISRQLVRPVTLSGEPKTIQANVQFEVVLERL